MLSVIPSKFGLKDQGETVLECLIQIKPDPPTKALERPRINLSLVLDRSGSMQGEKIATTRRAAKTAIAQLLKTDRVNVVAFDDQVEVVVPSTLVEEPEEICAKIDQIKDRGWTALHPGWLEGATQVAQHLKAGQLNRVLLLTDGEANRGETRPESIAADVRGLSQRGVSTTTIGFGKDYNEHLLRGMAESGDGNHYFIDTIERLFEVFETELSGMAMARGQKVRLRLETDAQLEVLTNLEKESDGSLRLNDLMLGNTIQVLLRLRCKPDLKNVLKCHLAYFDLEDKCDKVVVETLNLPSLTSKQWEHMGESPVVVQARVVYEATLARQEAVAQSQAGRRDQARAILLKAQDMLKQLPQNGESQRHISEIDLLLQDVQASDIQTLSKRSAYQARSQAYSSVSVSSMSSLPDDLKAVWDEMKKNGPAGIPKEQMDRLLEAMANQ